LAGQRLARWQAHKRRVSMAEIKIRKYREGIRNDSEMNFVCLECGSKNVGFISQDQPYYRYCRDCNERYYRNVCWRCGSVIDDRDPKNPYCCHCSWLKCTCGACNKNGCDTNAYRIHNGFKDHDPNFEDYDDWKDPIKKCPECGGHGYDSEDWGQCHTCAGSGQVMIDDNGIINPA